MRCWLTHGFLIGLILSMVSEARAEESSGVQTYSLFLGLDAGLAISQPTDTAIEGEKSGAHLAGSLLFSVATRGAVFDLGGGWMIDHLSGDAKPSTRADPDHSRVKTQAGFAALAARFKLRGPLELGLATQILYGTDTTFSPFEDEEDQVANVFLGPQIYYTWNSQSDWQQRIGLQAMTDLTINPRQVTWFTISYAIGFPVMKPVTRVEVKRQILYKDRVIVKERVQLKTETKPRYILEPQFVNFETDQATLSGRSQEFLRRMGAHLAVHPNQWEVVQIAGHTDSRGSLEHNQALGQRRAMTVFALLKQSGVPEERLQVMVRGPKDPVVDNETAVGLAQNRRVEVSFLGQTDEDALKLFIGQLKQQLNIPETCQSDSACR